MDLVYFGSGAFGVPTLRALSARHRIRAVVTQPDRPAGRGGVLTPTPVSAWTAAAGVRTLKPEHVSEPGVVREIRALKPDAFVVIAFGQKLPPELIEGIVAVNLHASLLPRWRGAAPINWAILAGDTETGNSVITLADRMDAGLVLGRSRRAIDPLVTAGELHDQLADDGPDLMCRVLDAVAAGTANPEEQDESRVTRAPKLSRGDGWIDFRANADECRRRTHGLWPWPGVGVEFRGAGLRLKRAQVEPADSQSRTGARDSATAVPGAIVDPDLGLVRCGEASLLRILEVQPAGGREMTWAEFARGRRPREGECLTGRTSP